MGQDKTRHKDGQKKYLVEIISRQKVRHLSRWFIVLFFAAFVLFIVHIDKDNSFK